MKVDVKQWLYIADFSYMFVHLIKRNLIMRLAALRRSTMCGLIATWYSTVENHVISEKDWGYLKKFNRRFDRHRIIWVDGRGTDKSQDKIKQSRI